jgi:uncharacterized membrane protein YhiD involved in acid resistance
METATTGIGVLIILGAIVLAACAIIMPLVVVLIHHELVTIRRALRAGLPQTPRKSILAQPQPTIRATPPQAAQTPAIRPPTKRAR